MSLESYTFAKKVGTLLRKKKLKMVTAESCTGGLLAAAITAVPGSSAYFEQGYIVYSNKAKKKVLKVKQKTLRKYGAVSEQAAKEMAQGSLKNSKAQISIAITGIAGPTGASKNKPIGTVCFAWAFPKLPTKTVTTRFSGNRNTVRTKATKFALKTLLELL